MMKSRKSSNYLSQTMKFREIQRGLTSEGFLLLRINLDIQLFGRRLTVRIIAEESSAYNKRS